MIDAVNRFIPVRKSVLTQEVQDEIILVDTGTQRSHLLNNVAAAVWRCCDGEKSVAEIARSLDGDVEAVIAALRNFENAGLLENGFSSQIENALLRRALISKVGAAAVVALPLIVSASLPLNSAAASPPKQNQARPRLYHRG